MPPRGPSCSARGRRRYYFYPGEGSWYTPFVGGSYLFEANGARLLDARTMFFYFATGITPAMTAANVGSGSQYAVGALDSDGNYLDGGKTYTLHLPPNIPAEDFWSVVLYDTQTRSMLQTDDPHPSVSSQTGTVEANDDGSVDVWFGPEAPEGKEGNWIQTVPGKGWCMLIRLYGPGESWFDKSWRPGRSSWSRSASSRRRASRRKPLRATTERLPVHDTR